MSQHVLLSPTAPKQPSKISYISWGCKNGCWRKRFFVKKLRIWNSDGYDRSMKLITRPKYLARSLTVVPLNLDIVCNRKYEKKIPYSLSSPSSAFPAKSSQFLNFQNTSRIDHGSNAGSQALLHTFQAISKWASFLKSGSLSNRLHDSLDPESRRFHIPWLVYIRKIGFIKNII